MNENVTNKTPKGRRWIARLLVSALCILLASSLLFVTVVAENIDLVVQFSSSKAISSNTIVGAIPISETDLLYWSGNRIFINSSLGNSAFDFPYENYNRLSCSVEGSFLYVASCDSYANVRITCYDISDIFSFFEVYTEVLYSTYQGQWNNSAGYGAFIAVVDEIVYGLVGFFSSTENLKRFVPFTFANREFDWHPSVDYYFVSNTNSGAVVRSNILFYDGCLYMPCIGLCYNFLSESRLSVSDSYSSLIVVFLYENNVYSLSSNSIFLLDANTRLFNSVGSYSGNIGFAYANNGILTTYGIAAGASIPYTVYTGLPTSEPPPESSDETTEPPPESSDESSEDPAGGGTKIWGSIVNADGSYTSSLLGTLDLSQATEVRAYIGSWTSKDSSYQSETPVPLTFYVYNGEEGPPDIYTFDYHAAGYSLSGDSVSDFTFPDIIGQFFTLPFNGETDLYFANVAPYGTVLVSTPFGDSFGGRVMLNLVSSDSYFRLDFVDEDTFTVVVYNEDPVGSRVSFEMDIRAYREGYRLEDGETSSSRWFYPSFGSSASYTAEYVTENGLYLVFVDSVNDTVYPWEDGTWSDIIGDANSRLEDISVDHALLESMANDAYGQYSFDPMTNQNFVGAVSQFNDIRDSSGGEYILRYMWGMWNVHPFASSMIVIVGTLAIVGFIIRKM